MIDLRNIHSINTPSLELPIVPVVKENPLILLAQEILTRGAPKYLDKFNELPNSFRQLIGQYYHANPKIHFTDDQEKRFEDFLAVFNQMQKDEHFSQWILQLLGNWKGDVCLRPLGNILNCAAPCLPDMIKNFTLLDAFDHPKKIYSAISKLARFYKDQSHYPYFNNAIEQAKTAEARSVLEGLCSDPEAFENWIHFAMGFPILGNSLLTSNRSLASLKEFLKSAVMKKHRIELQFTTENMIANYPAGFYTLSKNGKLFSSNVNHWIGLQLLLACPSLTKKVGILLDKFPGNEELILRLVEISAQETEVLLDQFKDSSNDRVQLILDILDFYLKFPRKSLKPIINAIQHPLCTLDYLTKIKLFAGNFPYHLETILNITKETFPIRLKVQETQNLILENENSVKYTLQQSSKQTQKLKKNIKSQKLALQALQKHWTATPLDYFLEAEKFPDTQVLLDGAASLLKSPPIKNGIAPLLEVFKANLPLFKRIQVLLKQLPSASYSTILFRLLEIYRSDPEDLEKILRLGEKDIDGVFALFYISGIMWYDVPYESALTVQFLEWFNENPDVTPLLRDFLRNKIPFWLYLVRKEFLHVIQTQPDLVKYIFKNSTFHSRLAGLYLKHLFKDQHSFIEKSNQEFKQSSITEDQIVHHSSFFLILKKHPQIPENIKKLLSVLVVCNNEMFARKLLKLYLKDEHLAKFLLEVAVDRHNFKLAQKIYYTLTTHPHSSSSIKIKKDILKNDFRAIESSFEANQENQPESDAVQKSDEKPDFNNLQTQFEQWKTLHRHTGKEEDKHALEHSVYLPKILSQALVDAQGRIDTSLIPAIKKQFFNGSGTHSTFDVHLIWILDQLVENPALLKEINSVKLPCALCSELIVRATLGLSKETKLTPTHLKLTLLISLMTYQRQGKVGSCSGSSLADSFQHLPLALVKAYKQILFHGKISIETRQKQLDFPLLIHLDQQPLDHSIDFNLEGLLVNASSSKAYIWDIPGLKYIANYFGITDEQIENWVKKALQTHSSHFQNIVGSSEDRHCSKKELINVLIEDVKDREIAYYLYLTVQNNPLNRCFENVLIAMDMGTSTTIRKALRYPFNLLNKLEVNLNVQGYVLNCGSHNKKLWNSAPFLQVMKALGANIEDVQKTILRIKHQDKKITLRQWIHELAATMGSEEYEKLYTAFFQGHPVQNKALLDTLTITIIDKKIAKKKLNPLNALLFPELYKEDILFQAVQYRLAPATKELFFDVLEKYKKQIKQRIQVVYDHARKPQGADNTFGGKILVDMKTFDSLSEKGMLNYEDFKKLCLSLVTDAFDQVIKQGQYSNEIAEQSKVVLENFISHPLIMESIFRKFISYNKDEIVHDFSLNKMDKMNYLPWKLLSGANATSAWNIATKLLTERQQYQYEFIPAKAVDVLRGLLNIGCVDGKRFDPQYYISGSIPQHAISFMLGHSSWHAIWQAQDPWLYLQQNFFHSENPIIDEAFKEKFIEKLKTQLKESDKNLEFHKITAHRLQDYRQAILDLFAKSKGSYLPLDDIECTVDSFLLEQLPIKPMAIHFANTNWLNEESHQDIHFCFIHNPCNDQVEMWKIDKDGKNLKKTPQSRWINGTPWILLTYY